MNQVILFCVSAFFGGLFGGFFAFLFGRLGARVDRNRKRWVKHHNALVGIESYCNVIVSMTPDNRLQFRLLKEVCSALPGGPTHLWSQPGPIPSKLGLSDDLLCLALKHLLFGLEIEIRRFNHAVETVNRATTDLHDALVAGRILLPVYRDNMLSLGVCPEFCVSDRFTLFRSFPRT